MPKAVGRTEPGRVANDREPLSSATQLANFGVRAAKFTHRVSDDGAADFLSNIVLPSSVAILAVSFEVSEAYDGTAVTVDVEIGGSSALFAPIPAAALIKHHEVLDTGAQTFSGEIGLNFNAVDSAAGEMTVVVSYLDLAEMG